MGDADVTAARRRLDRVRRSGDRGVAIVAAMAVVMLVGVLLTVVITIALSEATQSGRDRQRSSAVAAAEGKLDSTVALLQTANHLLVTGLCSTDASPLVDDVGVASDTFHLTTTVTYFDAAGLPIPCASLPAFLATDTVAEAKIVVRAASQALPGTSAAHRGVESLVRLTPSWGDAFEKAIFSDSGVAVGQNADLLESSTQASADVYSNGDFLCANNEVYEGDVEAQGAITGQGSCDIRGTAWAGRLVKTGGSNWHGTFGGDVRAVSSIALSSNAHVAGNLVAGGSIAAPGCPGTKCFPGDAAVTPPPVLPFPEINWNGTTQAVWQAKGFGSVQTLSAGSCGNAEQQASWVTDRVAAMSGNTILVVECANPVVLKGKTLNLSHSLVIVSPAGFSFTNKTEIKGPGSGVALYLIQPYTYYGAAPNCGTAATPVPGITLQNQFTVANTVDTLFYARCPIVKENKTVVSGQIYSAGGVSVGNNTDFQYEQVPIWAEVVTASSAPPYYSAEPQYKREIS